MQHWRTPYLGLRDIPPGLDDFELTTFFSYSAAERCTIDARRQQLHRLAVAMQIGFIRMTGRTLDAFEHVPKRLWTHIGEQIGVEPPEVASLRSLYADRARTLADHQQLAYQTLAFGRMSEHQRRYVVRWLRETLTGRANAGALLPELKRWFYEHRILLIADRELKRLIAGAQRDHETRYTAALLRAYGAQRLGEWDRAMTSSKPNGTPLQTWLWAAPLRQSTVQMSELFAKIEYLRGMGLQESWPEEVKDAVVQHYGRRCANRPPSASKQIASPRRTLEVACFLRYALCTSSDQLLLMLRRWIRKMANQATAATSSKHADGHVRLREFAVSVRGLATNEGLSHDELKSRLLAMVGEVLLEVNVSRAALARAYLIENARQARTVLVETRELAAPGRWRAPRH